MTTVQVFFGKQEILDMTDESTTLGKSLRGGTLGPGYTCHHLTNGAPVLLPWRPKVGDPYTLIRAHVFAVDNPAKGSYHNVFIGMDPSGHYVTGCGHALLSAPKESDHSPAAEVFTEAGENVGLGVTEMARESALFMGLVTKRQAHRHSFCGFYRVKNGENIHQCKHFAYVMKNMVTQAVVDSLEVGVKSSGSAAVAAKTSGFLGRVLRYAFKKPVCIEGDKGSGKTVGMQMLMAKMGVQWVAVNGNPGMESIDLLGHFVKVEDGSHVWKDGPLTQAFRRAASGEKVCLFVDEIGRIPSRERNLLIGPLAPDHAGYYVLPTGRIASIESPESGGRVGVEEVLRVKPENLWVVATTNMGAGYEVEDFDSALMDRFRFLRRDTSESLIRARLTPRLLDRDFSLDYLDRMLTFYSGMTRLMEQTEIHQIVNLRHLCEAVDLADKQSAIPLMLADMIPVWVDREPSGKLNSAQVDAVIQCLTAAFPSFSIDHADLGIGDEHEVSLDELDLPDWGSDAPELEF